MPQAIAAVVQAAGAAYSTAVSYGTSAGIAAGLSKATAVLVAQQTINLAITTAVSAGINAAARSQIPSPDFASQNRKQPIPDRISAYGRVRLGGAFMLFEADGNLSLNVYALHDGLVDGFEQFYLNDDRVTVTGGFVQSGPDLRYGRDGDLIQVYTRRGLPTETRYSQIANTTLWPTNARGDGVASLAMIAKASSKELFLRDYPNGRPEPSVVTRAQLCYDPRLGVRGTITSDADKDSSATWAWTANPALILLDYMTNTETGMGLPYSMFLPRIADWITAANVCDETVSGAHRYECHAVYAHSTPPADVIAMILATFDGWMAQDVNGVFTVQAGKYYAPTVTITDAHIVGMSRQFFVEDENNINEVTISYTDPDSDYVEVDTDPWRNEADIEATGETRSTPLSLPWVQSTDQARRLAKILVTRQTAPVRGTMVTTLDGLRAWGERRIRIQAPSDSDVMADIVVDIDAPTLNEDMTVSIPFTQTIAAGYDWTTEDLPVDPTRPPPETLPVPVIVSVGVNVAGGTPRLFFTLTNIDRPDFDYVIYWRVVGGSFVREEPTYIREPGNIFITTGPIPTQQTIEYQVATISAAGRESERTALASIASGGVDATNPFRLEVSSSGVIGTRAGAGVVTTASITVSVFGNIGTPTIVWNNVGGVIGAFADSDEAFTTTFTSTIVAGASDVATFKATVYDPTLDLTQEVIVSAAFIDNTT